MGYAVVAGERIVSDAVRGRCVNHLAISDINADMGDVYIVTGKENQIAGHEFRLAYRTAGSGLNVRGAGQVNALLGVNVLDKARAVKAVGRRTAPDVRHSEILTGQADDAVSPGKVGFMAGRWELLPSSPSTARWLSRWNSATAALVAGP